MKGRLVVDSVINHYLLVFDHARGELVETVDFGADVDAATAAYSARERAHREDAHIDIVLVGSDSLETVKVTHSTYFARSGESDLRDLLRLDELTSSRG